MRALFILLLLANVGFAGWLVYNQQQVAKTSADTTSVSSPVAGAEVVVLLRELHDADELEASAQASKPAEPQQKASDTAESARELDSVANKTVSLQPAVTADSSSQKPSQQLPEQISIQKSEKRTERQQTGQQAPAVKAAAQATSKTAVSCHTLGPFRKLDTLREVIRELRSDVLEASFRSTEERERSLFWVYLQPEADLTSAKNTTRMLRNKKIRDSYIIAEGKNRFGISLGHFRDKSRAYGLRDKVAGMGFRPVVEPVFRTYTLYWLDYKTGAGSRPPAILQSGKLDKSVNHFDRNCQ